MKRALQVILFLIIIFFSLFGYSQNYVTSGGGTNWSDGNSWTPFISGGPTSADGTITINHNLTVDVNVAVDELTINVNKTLTIPNGVTMTLENGSGSDLAFQSGFGNAVLNVSGRLLVLQDAVISNSSSNRLKILNGGVYEHNYSTTAGVIYSANWATGSTLEITGYTTPGGPPTGLNQSFYNFTWDCPSLGEFIDLDGVLTTVNGDLTISDTNGNFLVFTQASDLTLNVGGDFIISGSSAIAFNGFTGGITTDVNISGDLNYTSSSQSWFSVDGDAVLNIVGNIQINSSGGIDLVALAGSGTGSTIMNVSGDFLLNSGELKNTTDASTCDIVFNGTVDAQTFTNTGTISERLNFEVNNGAFVDLGTSPISGTGSFTLNGGGTVKVGSPNGLTTGTSSGNIRVGGTRVYAANSNIVYNGTAAQVLGNEWGASGALNGVAVNLEIDNTSGVSNNIVGGTSLVGDLTLTNGPLNIGNSNSLNVESNFIVTSGTIGGLSSSNLTFSGSGTMGILSMESGSQNLSNLTISRSGDLTLGSALTIGGTLSLTGNLDFSGQSLTINGSSIDGSGGGGLKSNSTSNLTFGGSTYSGSIPYAGSGNQLNNLTFNTTGGAYTWNSAVTINNNLNLNFGTLTHSSGLTMGTGSTFVKGAGSLTTSSPGALTSYNLVYNSAGNSGLELPSSSTTLNNLTVNVSGTLALQSTTTINGDLSISSGTLDVGSHNLTMAGTNWTANGGTFTISSSNTVTFSGTTAMGGTSVGGTQFGNLTINGGATLSAPNANMNVSGVWNNAGTFTPNSGTVTFNGGNQNIDPNGQSFNSVDFAGTGTKTLQSALDVNGDLTISSTLNVGANNSINVAGTWTNSGTFTPGNGTVTFDGAAQTITSVGQSFNSITLSNSGTKTLGDALDVNGTLTIGSGITLDVSVSNNSINLAGNWTNNGGIFNARTGNVTFDGGTMAINGSGTTNFNDITTGASSHINMNGIASLSGVLTLGTSSTFDADGSGSGVFTLVSDATDDARIDVLPSGASVTGNVTVQRYLPSYGSKRWRNIASTVLDASVSDLQNEILISGPFTGSDNPGALGSLAYYDNTQAGATLDDRWVYYPVSTNTEVLTTTGSEGRGYSIWVRDVGAVTFDLRGPVNQGTINLNLNGSNELWNLVGNPYPSSIDWNNGSGWTKTSIQGNGISVWDGTQYLTWNGSTGSLGNGRIPMGMSFWVQGSDGSVALTINENAKTSTTGTVHRVITPSYLELSLTDGTYTDKTYIEFKDGASLSYEINDLSKLQNAIFNLSSYSDDDHELAINSISNFVCSSEIALNISNIWEGAYTLGWSNMESIDTNINIILNDHFTGESYNLRETEGDIPVVVTADEATYGNERFTITFQEFDFSTDLEISGQQLCDQNMVGEITLSGSETGVDYVILKDGVEIATATGDGTDIVFELASDVLAIGENSFDVKASRGDCAQLDFPDPVIVNIIEKPSIDYNVESNELNTSSSGDLQWYEDGAAIEGAISQVFTPDHNGNYTVQVSNQTCSLSSDTYEVTCLFSIDLNIVGTQVCEFGNVGEIVIEQSEKNVTYTILKNDMEIAQVIGDDSNLVVDVPEEVLAEGDNMFTVRVGGTECIQKDVPEPVTINIVLQPSISYDPVTNILSTDGTGELQWFENNIAIEGANSSSLQLDNSGGSYYVISSNTSCSFVSDEYIVTGVHDELENVGIDIFPNPVSDLLFVRFSNNLSDSVLLRVISNSGKLIEEIQTDKYLTSIDVVNISEGVFYVEIIDQKNHYISRIIKK